MPVKKILHILVGLIILLPVVIFITFGMLKLMEAIIL
tara:strand:- start:2075 stop:2185 length:111 start_codon:yes stop_codon:yes gene_type:complete